MGSFCANPVNLDIKNVVLREDSLKYDDKQLKYANFLQARLDKFTKSRY